MDRNLLLASAAFALLGTVAIGMLFSATTRSAGADIQAAPSPSTVAPTERAAPGASREPMPDRPTGPFRGAQDVVGNKDVSLPAPEQQGHEPTHQEQREALIAPDELERRDRAREAHHERIIETTTQRFISYATSKGVDRQEALDAAAKLEDHLHADRAVRDAVRTGDLTRDEAKAELAEMRQRIDDELMTVLGEEDYAELRRAVPGKW